MINARLSEKSLDHPALQQTVDNIIKWKTTPPFIKMGRSAWMPLNESVHISLDGREFQINSLKIKGVGLCDHLGRVFPPRTEPYYRIHPHIGFTRTGEIIHIKSDPSPIGGIVFEKAQNEFNISRRLLAADCPSIIPLFLYEYFEPELIFNVNGSKSSSYGAVISGLPDKNLIRFDTVLFYENAKIEDRNIINSWADALGYSGDKNYLSVVKVIARLYGKAIKSFHNSGFYRYSGQPDNYAYSLQTKKVFLIDLDTSRKLTECSEAEKPLQLIRDVVSGLYGITAYVLRKANINIYTPEVFNGRKILESLLEGYFEDVPQEKIHSFSEQLDSHYSMIYDEASAAHKFMERNNSNELITDFQEYRHQTIKQYWIDRDKTLCFYLALVWEIYVYSNDAKKYPLPYSKSKLIEYISKYSSREVSDYVFSCFRPKQFHGSI